MKKTPWGAIATTGLGGLMAGALAWGAVGMAGAQSAGAHPTRNGTAPVALPCDGSPLTLGGATVTCSGAGTSVPFQAEVRVEKFNVKQEFLVLKGTSTGGAIITTLGVAETGATGRITVGVSSPGTAPMQVTIAVQAPQGQVIRAFAAKQPDVDHIDVKQEFGPQVAVKR
jgi:hypothetical protein